MKQYGVMDVVLPALSAPDTLPAEMRGSGGVLVGEVVETHVQRMTRLAFDAPVTEKEDNFAREWVRLGNATAAYRLAFDTDNMTRNSIAIKASRLLDESRMIKRVREYKAASIQAYVFDLDAMMADDMAIIEAYSKVVELTQYVWDACRYCYGINNRFQWVNLEEFTEALARAIDENETRVMVKKHPKPLPSDEGGYGYTRQNSPRIECPRCEGSGLQRAIIADTRDLSPAAARLYKGIKVGNNGQVEVLMHDVDKAKERILRRCGAYGDDAASVARGAAAGAAAGAAVASRVDKMTAEEAQRAYLQLANGG
jgi:phage terminase small subunit